MENDKPGKHWLQRKTQVTVLISDKVGFKAKKIAISKKGHYIIIKGSTHQEYITEMGKQQNTEPQNINWKWIEFKKKIDKFTIVFVDLHILLLAMRKSTKV